LNFGQNIYGKKCGFIGNLLGEHIENIRNIVGNVTENRWEHDGNFFFFLKKKF